MPQFKGEGQHIAEVLASYLPEVGQWRNYATVAAHDDDLTGEQREAWGTCASLLRDAAEKIDAAISAVPA